ncbi:MAG: hypothetical protein Q4D71_08170 [Oscillospiraceae bacterium]|nr:hypothetical protein [Oscillospiraceae bacterium]
MIFTVEEKQILAMYDEGSVRDTFERLADAYIDICSYEEDPFLEKTVFSALQKLSLVESLEYRRAMKDKDRPVGIWPVVGLEKQSL